MFESTISNKPKVDDVSVGPETPETPVTEPTKMPESKPAETTPAPVVVEENPRKVTWNVPKGTQDVVVNVYGTDGKFINYYTITNYITLKPGYKIEVIAK